MSLIIFFLALVVAFLLYVILTNRKGTEPQIPEFQAHRGFWLDGEKENSLQAFRKAKRLGFKMCELDVQLSQDGIPVVHHDPFLLDLRSQKIFINQLSAQELFKQYGVVSLWEVLSDSEGTEMYNVEIKTEHLRFVRIARKVGNLLKDYEGRVIISSFHPLALVVAGFHCPKVPKAYLVNNLKLDKWFWLSLIPVKWLHPQHELVTPAVLDQMKRRGIKVAVWTVNEEANAHRLLQMGVQSVITDSLLHTAQRGPA